MFKVEIEKLDEERLWKYEVSQQDVTISYSEALELLAASQEFRSFLTSILRESPFDAYRWETPPIDTGSATRTFEFILSKASGFASREPDAAAFGEHFAERDKQEGIVCFPNLRGDSTMIVPSPLIDHNAYGHLAAFARKAPASQVDMLWRTVGKTVQQQIGKKPIWLSTAGGGVAWLHIRIDPSPKYYGYPPYKQTT